MELFNDGDGKSGLESLIALFTITIINVGAATMSEYEQGRRLKFMALYTAVGLIAIAPMVYITSARQKKSTSGIHLFEFDRATTHVGRWLLACTILLFGSFVGLGFAGKWIGQAPPKLVVKGTELVAFDNGAPAMRLDVLARPENFGGRVPSDFTLETSLGDVAGANWSLAKLECYEVIDGRKERVSLTTPVFTDSSVTTQAVDSVVRGIISPDSNYILELYFKPKGSDVAVYESAYEGMSDQERKERAQKLVKSHQEAYVEASKEIQELGKINLSVE